MQKLLLILFSLSSAFSLSGQTTEMPTVRQILAQFEGLGQVSHNPQREIISCTRETTFNAGTPSWDSISQIISVVDDNNGYLTYSESHYQYDDSLGWVIEVEQIAYGIIDPDNPLNPGLDSLIQFAADPVSGDWVPLVKLYPTYTPSGQFAQIDIYFNTGFFGLPLGIIYFGSNLFYYDSNDLLIATATKQANIFTMELENGDTTSFAYNLDGQLIQETTWEWNGDDMIYDPVSRYSYTYIGAGTDVSTWTIEEGINGDFEYVSRITYTYNKPGQVSKEDIEIGEPGNWTLVQEVNYSYDGLDRLTQRLEQSIAGNGTKTPIARINYAHDTPQNWTVEAISQSYIGGSWVNSGRVILEDCDNAGGAPTAPTSLVATASGPTSILLEWSDNSDNESAFAIERSPNGTNFTEIIQVTANTESYTDTGLNPATTYYYQVRALNSTGPSAYSNIASAQTWTTSISDPTAAGFQNSWFQADGQLFLDLSTDADVRHLHVIDLQGKAVFSADISNQLRTLNTTHLHKGLYMIQVTMNDGSRATRQAMKW